MDENAQSKIAKDVEIVGTVKSTGSVHIDGKLDGELVCQGDVTVGQSATIKGNINSNAVIIQGAVTGNVTAKDKIDMKSTARVTGDIRSKRLAVEDGVTFVGKSEVNPGGAPAAAAAPAAAPRPEVKPAEKPAPLAGKR